MQLSSDRRRVVALLGPTNTGKTHLAMERMLARPSGMMGFPLRLLARENYDKACKIKGRLQVALITGEEKIIPPAPRYFICTVESMPTDKPVEFLCIDEVQMCADPDRGHIFTERVLKARGISETMFLGAETIRPLLGALVPDCEFETRARISTLSYTGFRKVTRLPARSAIVAFSANQVYGLAELVKRQRGGAAVVLGALSPRTRNAQVGMYQAGEVDYLVATDAIGMGLNMDVDHVAFAGTRKFDGRRRRRLSPAELAQAAGRAGRHMNDGTFGATADEPPLDRKAVEAIERHEFDAIRQLSWRASKLDFSSVNALRRSLNARPPHDALKRAREADDEVFLEKLLDMADIADIARSETAVRLLWDVCQIPDFEKVLSDAHAGLLSSIYKHLTGTGGRLPADWMEARVHRLDHLDGDINTLTQRIATVRTWTYISFQSAWIDNPVSWQDRTREIENKLSDALHERLTHRFVDRNTAALVRRISGRESLLAAIRDDGEVLVEGVPAGRLNGFRFTAMESAAAGAGKAVTSAVQRALRDEIRKRVKLFLDVEDGAITFAALSGDEAGRIMWDGAPLARLVKGGDIRHPRIHLNINAMLGAAERGAVQSRLESWLASHLAEKFAAVDKLREGEGLDGAARGVAFQLWEALGSLPRRQLEDGLKVCGKESRYKLRRLGVVIGRETVYQNIMLKPTQAGLRGLLWCLANGVSPVPGPPAPGLCSIETDPALPAAFYDAVGFRALKGMAVRVDILERVAEKAWELSASGPFKAGPELMNPAGCGPEELHRILKSFGFKTWEEEGARMYRAAKRPDAGRKQPKRMEAGESPKPRGGRKPGKRDDKREAGPRTYQAAPPKGEGKTGIDPGNPFARLAELKTG